MVILIIQNRLITCHSKTSGFHVNMSWQDWQFKWMTPSGLGL